MCVRVVDVYIVLRNLKKTIYTLVNPTIIFVQKQIKIEISQAELKSMSVMGQAQEPAHTASLVAWHEPPPQTDLAGPPRRLGAPRAPHVRALPPSLSPNSPAARLPLRRRRGVMPRRRRRCRPFDAPTAASSQRAVQQSPPPHSPLPATRLA